ncbi:hypothetical protein GCM10023321_61210 [Pseudonocardia eucalypti]|uniref:DUF2530 domain-containing protein n=1 Tax=Pseudonocardia eucalypti TaxID=648755 RepID=A0ABP9QUV2_9PSEU
MPVTRPQPEEEGRPTHASGRPASFDDIVAGWVAEGTVPRWPDPPAARQAAAEQPVDPPPAPSVCPPYDMLAGQDHFVPPDPPPLPRMSFAAMAVLILVSAGIVLLAVHDTLRLDSAVCLPLGLVLISTGLGWLLLRCWPARTKPDAEGPDDGAIV